jgi:hypothetical protein
VAPQSVILGIRVAFAFHSVAPQSVIHSVAPQSVIHSVAPQNRWQSVVPQLLILGIGVAFHLAFGGGISFTVAIN